MKIIIKVLLLTFSINLFSQQSIRYTNDMQFVLGDVKQAFIQDRISNKTQVDNLIKGFQNLKVNGIRIPIFAEGLEPNKALLDYFFEQAKINGFKIFANPALHAGGQRIANGVLTHDKAGGPVKDDPLKTQILIDRIKAFAAEYPCDWICPFNEDSRPGGAWSVAQFNMIFQQLYGQLNGAELIGACQWGLEAGIQTFEDTEIDKYISIATTHNLGFNHNLWTGFINRAKALNLPVWDSEVNHNKKYDDKLTRLEVALERKVDGLVIYNSWRGINLSNGNLNNTERLLEQQALFLSPNTYTPSILYFDDIFVYPNPAKDLLNIAGVESTNQLTIFNVKGQADLKARNTNNINVDALIPGIYYLQIVQQHVETKTVKINIIRY